MFSVKNLFQCGRALLGLCLVAMLMTGAGLSGAAAAQQRLMVYGDSLVAGYGLDAGDGLPEQLQTVLRESGLDVKVLNAGVSGDTTAGGLARLDWALADRPDAVIIVLGGNDLLRGLSPQQTRDNLHKMLTRLRQDGISVLLCGMLAPVNLGPDYRAQFDAIYPELAEEFGIGFYPFLLDGVALRPELNLPDGLHPNKAGVRKIADSILPHAVKLLQGD